MISIPWLDTWLEIVKQYGPIVGLFLAFIWWQSRQISDLIDELKDSYQGEIDRMHEREHRFLDYFLGPQASSDDMPELPSD